MGCSEAKKLTEEEIRQRLPELKGWSVENGKLHKVYVFKDFKEAFGFMASAALAAEAMDHHPDWSNSYKKVVVDLTTHAVGGITSLDAELAAKFDRLAKLPS